MTEREGWDAAAGPLRLGERIIRRTLTERRLSRRLTDGLLRSGDGGSTQSCLSALPDTGVQRLPARAPARVLASCLVAAPVSLSSRLQKISPTTASILNIIGTIQQAISQFRGFAASHALEFVEIRLLDYCRADHLFYVSAPIAMQRRSGAEGRRW